jgi:hypothetical protein
LSRWAVSLPEGSFAQTVVGTVATKTIKTTLINFAILPFIIIPLYSKKIGNSEFRIILTGSEIYV